jgi:hypothetical protein
VIIRKAAKFNKVTLPDTLFTKEDIQEPPTSYRTSITVWGSWLQNMSICTAQFKHSCYQLKNMTSVLTRSTGLENRCSKFPVGGSCISSFVNSVSGKVTLLNFERTWWMLFQKRVVCTKIDIYVLFVEMLYFYIT